MSFVLLLLGIHKVSTDFDYQSDLFFFALSGCDDGRQRILKVDLNRSYHLLCRLAR